MQLTMLLGIIFYLPIVFGVNTTNTTINRARCFQKKDDIFISKRRASWMHARKICAFNKLVFCGNECAESFVNGTFHIWTNQIQGDSFGSVINTSTFCFTQNFNDTSKNIYALYNATSREINMRNPYYHAKYLCRPKGNSELRVTYRKVSFMQYDKWIRKKWKLESKINVEDIHTCALLCTNYIYTNCYGFFHNNNNSECQLIILQLRNFTNTPFFILVERSLYETNIYFRNDMCITNDDRTIENLRYNELEDTSNILSIIYGQINVSFPIQLDYEQMRNETYINCSKIFEKNNIYEKPIPSMHFIDRDKALQMNETDAIIHFEVYENNQIVRLGLFKHYRGKPLFSWFNKSSAGRSESANAFAVNTFDFIINEDNLMFVIKKQDNPNYHLTIINNLENSYCSNDTVEILGYPQIWYSKQQTER
ncbi:hypothetical protein SNEBB_005017 [Seison nebaliae]|nr:hypothetical protein SNEBB_005017 [Seison nebaliae]